MKKADGGDGGNAAGSAGDATAVMVRDLLIVDRWPLELTYGEAEV